MLMSAAWCIWQGMSDLSEPVAMVTIILGGILFLIGIVFPNVMNPKSITRINQKRIEGSWQQKSTGAEIRSFTVTKSGLALKGEFFDTNWTWQSCTRFFENEHGFLIKFFTGESRFIPKRVFKNQEQVDEFRVLIDRNIKNRYSLLWN